MTCELHLMREDTIVASFSSLDQDELPYRSQVAQLLLDCFCARRKEPGTDVCKFGRVELSRLCIARSRASLAVTVGSRSSIG